MLKGDSKTQIALMNIHERFLFSFFFPVFFAISHLRIPFFPSLSLTKCKIRVFASKITRERAKEQVQLNAAHKGMHVEQNFFSVCVCAHQCKHVLVSVLNYKFWCGHTFSTVYSSSPRYFCFSSWICVAYYFFTFEHMVFFLVFFLYIFGVFSFFMHLSVVLKSAKLQNVTNIWSYGLVDIRLCQMKLSRQNNIYPDKIVSIWFKRIKLCQFLSGKTS